MSMAPGEVKIPLPITMLMMMLNASAVPKFCRNEELWALLDEVPAIPPYSNAGSPPRRGALLSSSWTDILVAVG